MRNKYFTIIITLLISNLTLAWHVYANGASDSPRPPETTTSYTLTNLYNRLTAGTAGTPSTFTEPSRGPETGSTHSLNEIMAVAPATDGANEATAAEVASGKTLWSLRSGPWSEQTGSAT